jgi:hypothetical protein
MSGFDFTELLIHDCQFAGGIQKLETRKAPEVPERD